MKKNNGKLVQDAVKRNQHITISFQETKQAEMGFIQSVKIVEITKQEERNNGIIKM